MKWAQTKKAVFFNNASCSNLISSPILSSLLRISVTILPVVSPSQSFTAGSMAASSCSFGASCFKVSNLNFGSGTTKIGVLQPLNAIKLRTPLRYDGLKLSTQSGKSLLGCECLSVSSKASSITNLEDVSEESKSSGAVSPLIPNSLEVETLLTQICDTSSIAEFELKLGGFRLYVMRNLKGDGNNTPPLVSAPVISTAVETQAPEVHSSVPSTSLSISKPVASSGGQRFSLDRAADEGLVVINSPMVGLFSSRRVIKKKKMPPSCKENQAVKEGQVVCYIEQLGSQYPVETEVAGEIIKILREDGDPVGYGDPLIAILPSFPGIKKLQ